MIVIGLGNEFRHDDAAGLIVARRLRELGLPAEEHDRDPVALINRWTGETGVILVDAVYSGTAPGTLHRIDMSASRLPREPFLRSTHAFRLVEAVELSRVVGTLPPHIFFFGVEGMDFTPGIGVSAEVESALPILTQEVLSLIVKAVS